MYSILLSGPPYSAIINLAILQKANSSSVWVNAKLLAVDIVIVIRFSSEIIKKTTH